MADKNKNGVDDAKEEFKDIDNDGINDADQYIPTTQGAGVSVGSVSIPKWLTNISDNLPEDQARNLVLSLSLKKDRNSVKAYREIAKFITGNANASPEDVSVAWNNAIDIAVLAGASVQTVVRDSRFKNVILSNTSYQPVAPRTPAPTQRAYSLTSRQDADTVLSQYMINFLGTAPNKKQKDAFFKQLTAAQKAAPTVTRYGVNSSTTTGGGVDPQQFAQKFILSQIKPKNTDLDGQLGEVQDSLRQFASQNNVNVSDYELFTMVRRVANGEDLNTVKAAFNERAQKKYTALADLLKQDPTKSVYDVSLEYIRDMADVLEIDPNQLTVKDIEPAISYVDNGSQRTLASWEWKKQLRKDPRFQYTSRAKDEATGLAASFARAFGVNL